MGGESSRVTDGTHAAFPTGIGDRSIRPHSPLQLVGHVALTGFYLLVKWMGSPTLYAMRRIGLRAAWPRRLDEVANRALLPLSERPDTKPRQDVEVALRPGDALPDVEVWFPGGTRRSLRMCLGRPLLLVLARGSWCPYSRLHLADIAASADRFEALGVQLLGVTSYQDAEWWQAHGIRFPVTADPEGQLFGALGVRAESWLEEAWGRVLPHESTWLFDAPGRLIAADVRKVSGIRLGQRFLGAEVWLSIAEATVTPGSP